MALEKGTEEWQMFGDYFNLCKKYWKPTLDDAYWDNLINDVDKFVKKFESIGLAKQIALTFIDYQEKKAKGKI